MVMLLGWDDAVRRRGLGVSGYTRIKARLVIGGRGYWVELCGISRDALVFLISTVCMPCHFCHSAVTKRHGTSTISIRVDGHLKAMVQLGIMKFQKKKNQTAEVLTAKCRNISERGPKIKDKKEC